MSRRRFLKLAGSGIAIVVVGGTVWRAFSNGVFSTGQGPAYEPWNEWKTESQQGAGPLSLVSSAILAANAHNTQPWLFVVNPNKIDLFADTKRNIGAIDPYLREMYEGLGCALENLVLAAEAKGYTYNLKLMPDPTSKTHVVAWPYPLQLCIGHSNNSTFSKTRSSQVYGHCNVVRVILSAHIIRRVS